MKSKATHSMLFLLLFSIAANAQDRSINSSAKHLIDSTEAVTLIRDYVTNIPNIAKDSCVGFDVPSKVFEKYFPEESAVKAFQDYHIGFLLYLLLDNEGNYYLAIRPVFDKDFDGCKLPPLDASAEYDISNSTFNLKSPGGGYHLIEDHLYKYTNPIQNPSSQIKGSKAIADSATFYRNLRDKAPNFAIPAVAFIHSFEIGILLTQSSLVSGIRFYIGRKFDSSSQACITASSTQVQWAAGNHMRLIAFSVIDGKSYVKVDDYGDAYIFERTRPPF